MAASMMRRLEFNRKLWLLAVGGIVVSVSAVGQIAAARSGTDAHTEATPAKLPVFEVVSIRPCQDPRQHQVPGPGGMYPPRGNSSPGRLRTGCYPLLDDHGMGLIRSAYADTFTPINGGPSWIHSAFYEIDAVAEGSPSVKTMMGPMMQALLEDRFHLKIHHQTGEGPVYFLSVAHGGPKLHPFVEGSCVLRTSSPPSALQPGQEYCESLMGGGSSASVEDQGVMLDYFSRQLLGVLDRPVIDKTGITGRFDIHVQFSREGTKMAGMALREPVEGSASESAPDPSGPPSIFTAIEEQLGLKLQPAKGPVDVIVIDHVERPSAN